MRDGAPAFAISANSGHSWWQVQVEFIHFCTLRKPYYDRVSLYPSKKAVILTGFHWHGIFAISRIFDAIVTGSSREEPVNSDRKPRSFFLLAEESGGLEARATWTYRRSMILGKILKSIGEATNRNTNTRNLNFKVKLSILLLVKYNQVHPHNPLTYFLAATTSKFNFTPRNLHRLIS